MKKFKVQNLKSNIESGFTLIEIVLGVLIFSMVIAAVYTTFRTGLMVYRSGTSMKTVYVSSRAVVDIVQPDLRSICGIEETFYDVPPPPPPEQGAESTTYGEDTIIIDETSYSRNPYPFSGNTATVSFYCIQETPVFHKSLLREQIVALRYYLDGKTLLRERAEITSARTGPGIAIVEEIADQLVSFRIRYGYFKENKWNWVEDWDSRLDKYRHPREPVEDSELNSPQTVPIRIYPDLLPEAVEFTFSIQETESGKKPVIHEFQLIAKIPTAKPSW